MNIITRGLGSSLLVTGGLGSSGNSVTTSCHIIVAAVAFPKTIVATHDSVNTCYSVGSSVTIFSVARSVETIMAVAPTRLITILAEVCTCQ